MESQFETADNKEIATMAKMCIDKGIDFGNPFTDKNYKILSPISKLFGYSKLDGFDFEYICAFIFDNYHLLQSWLDKTTSYQSISGKLVKPELKKYEVLYKVSVKEYVLEYYKIEWQSFKKEWVEESIHDSLSNGSWDYFDQTPIDRDVVDTDTTEFKIESVESLKDLNLEDVEKNIIKLLSENTEKIVENFDRKTLIGIKRIIDSKLKSL